MDSANSFIQGRSSMSAADPRAAAFRTLQRVLGGQTLDQVFERNADALDARNRGFARELATGVVRRYFSLSADVSRFVRRPIAEIDTDVLILLLLGAYQIRYMRVPGFAAVHATVELARVTPARSAGGLINAVLRRVAESEAPASLDAQSRYDHPSWLIEAFRLAYPDSWEALLLTSLGRAPLSVRTNPQLVTRGDYLSRLIDEGIEASATKLSLVGVQFANPMDSAAIPGYSAGFCTIQDEGAQLAVPHLLLQGGLRVLDACAAPGNKTSQIIEAAPNCQLVALDIDAQRVASTRRNLARLQHAQNVSVADLSDLAAWWDGVPFDRILLDAPCSGTGTMRRHPEIKLLRQPEDVQRLVQVQRTLLGAAWQVLKPGGFLVYSTCSLLPQENEQVIEHFLRNTPDAQVHQVNPESVENSRGVRAHANNPVMLLPVQDGTDGFFMARLRKLTA